MLTIWAAAALLAPVSLAGAPGTWSETGSMQKPRNEFALAALPGNRALAIGGLSFVPVPHGNKTVYLAEAELYDAATGTWTPAGSMSRARAYHQAVTLRDGRVLVMGGIAEVAGPTATAELWNPATKLWSPAASMASPRYYFTATLLTDGRVLVVGGCAVAGCAAAATTGELFDPATGTWSATGPMVQGRASHASVLLPDGRVMAVGGDSIGWDTTEIFDPQTNQWTDGGLLTLGRSSHAAAALSSGQVLTAGGMDMWGAINGSGDVGDPATTTWTPAPDMFDARMYFPLVALEDGRALAIGGQQVQLHSFVDIPRCEIFDPLTGTWTRTGSMAVARESHSAAVLSNGQVLVAGGVDGASGLFTTRVEAYTPNVVPRSFTETFDGQADDASTLATGWRALTGTANPSGPSPEFVLDDGVNAAKLTSQDDAGSLFGSGHLFLENDFLAVDPAAQGRGDALLFTNEFLVSNNASSIDLNGASVSVDYSNGDAAAAGPALQFAFQLSTGQWFVHSQALAGNTTQAVSHGTMGSGPIGPTMTFVPLAVDPGAAADARLVPNPAAARSLSAAELSKVIAAGVYSNPSPADPAPTRLDNYQIAGFAVGCRPGLVAELRLTPLPGRVARLAWAAAARGTSFDVVRGSLTALAATRGNFAAAVDSCLANNIAASALDDAAIPAAASGFFYVVRASGCEGGSYDSGSSSQVGSRDAGIAAAPATCP